MSMNINLVQIIVFIVVIGGGLIYAFTVGNKREAGSGLKGMSDATLDRTQHHRDHFFGGPNSGDQG